MTNPAASRVGLSGAGLRVVRRWPTKKAKSWSADFVERCKNDPNVLAVVAIGSAIREVPASADVDLILIYRDSALEVRSPIEVDLRQYDAAEVERLALEGHDLLGWALRLGKVVLEREGRWTVLAERLRATLPWPDADVARRRAQHSERLLEYAAEVGDEDAAAEQRVTYLTHLARSELLDRNVFPASRPELPDQLKEVGESELAERLAEALAKRTI